MTETTLYRIEEFNTTGWETAPGGCTQLTKEQATSKLEELLAEGYNPNRLRAIPDVN
jgi:hypothetical protein